MKYSEFKKQADFDNTIYKIFSKLDGSGYRNPLINSYNIKAKAPLLTAPTMQDKKDWNSSMIKAVPPAERLQDKLDQMGIPPQYKVPYEQSPREYVQDNLYLHAKQPWKANQPTTAANTTAQSNQYTKRQQQKPSQPITTINQQGVLTRSTTPMGVGANRTMSAADIAPDPNKKPGYSVAVDALKDPEAVKKFLKDREQMVRSNTSSGSLIDALGWKKALGFGEINDDDKAAVFQKFKEENPNFVPSLAEAVKNGSPEAIKELQQFVSGKDGASMFNEEEMKQITGAAKSASWNAIKSDPFGNLPKVIGLFLRQQGLGGMAQYAENPMVFYGGLLALLFGGGMLLSGGDSQPTVVNNYYGYQQPAGYNRIPYM